MRIHTGPGYVVATHKIPEQVVDGKRLGATFRFDSRSLAYPVKAKADLRSMLWTRHIPILDQGQLGSCEGNAETGCIASSPLWEALPAGHPVLNENLAVKLYSGATHRDPYSGDYPPDDTGTDSTSVSKEAKAEKLIGGYLNCATVDLLAAALQTGPVNCAFNWYSSFDNPPATGPVTIASTAHVRGGHALCFRGVDVATKRFQVDNSWSADWGNNGSFEIGYDTMDRLFGEGGEAVQPTPLTDVPVPVPTPDQALWNAVGDWAVFGGQTRTRPDLVTVQAALLDWQKAVGVT